MTELGSQVVIAWIVVQIIQALKRFELVPWVHATTDSMNRVIGAILAAVAAVGISFHFDATAGTLLISGLTLTSVLTLAWTAVQQFAMQEIIYFSSVKPAVTASALSGSVPGDRVPLAVDTAKIIKAINDQP